MAISTQLSTAEIIRVGDAAYAGKTVNVILCSVGATGYNSSSSVADWQSVELSGNGYAAYSEVLASPSAGTYNNASGRYEIPTITAEFTASGGVLTYDRLIIYISGAPDVLHSVLSESPAISIVDGGSQTYKIDLITDD